MSEFVAVDGATVEPEENAVSADFEILTPPSSVMLSSGNGVFAGTLSLLITNATDGVYTQTGGAFPATITPGAQNALSESKNLVLDGDSGPTVQVPGQTSSTPPVTGTISVTPYISDPNNSVLKAN